MLYLYVHFYTIHYLYRYAFSCLVPLGMSLLDAQFSSQARTQPTQKIPVQNLSEFSVPISESSKQKGKFGTIKSKSKKSLMKMKNFFKRGDSYA